MKRGISLALALVMFLALCLPALAEGVLPDGTLFKSGKSEAEMEAEQEQNFDKELPG